MGYCYGNYGPNSNSPTWDIRCDTEPDIAALDTSNIPAGSTVYVISNGKILILNTRKQWNEQGAQV